MTLIYLIFALITGALPADGNLLITGVSEDCLLVTSAGQLPTEVTPPAAALQFHLPFNNSSRHPVSLAELEFEEEIVEGSDLIKVSTSFFVKFALAPLRIAPPSPGIFRQHLFRPSGRSKMILFQNFLI